MFCLRQHFGEIDLLVSYVFVGIKLDLKFDDMWDYSNPENSEGIFRDEIRKRSDNAFVIWELQTQVANSLRLQGKFDNCLQVLNSIQAGIEFAPDNAHKSLVGARYNFELGKLLLDIGRIKEANRYFEFAFQICKRIDGDNFILNVIEKLASTSVSDVAITEHLRTIERLAGSTSKKSNLNIGYHASILGHIYVNTGQHQRALEQYMHARDVFSKHNKANLSRILLSNICRVQRFLGQHKLALLELRIMEQSPQNNWEDAYVMQEIAENLLEIGHESAKEYFIKALHIFATRTFMIYEDQDRMARLQKLVSD